MWRPSSTTAAAVSSQDVSMPNTRMLLLIGLVSSKCLKKILIRQEEGHPSAPSFHDHALVDAFAVAEDQGPAAGLAAVVHDGEAALGQHRGQGRQEGLLVEIRGAADDQRVLQPLDAGLLP